LCVFEDLLADSQLICDPRSPTSVTGVRLRRPRTITKFLRDNYETILSASIIGGTALVPIAVITKIKLILIFGQLILALGFIGLGA